MFGALELGLIYGAMALGVYLTFKVLNFPDLTVASASPAVSASVFPLLPELDIVS